jgi:hypothetical protein
MSNPRQIRVFIGATVLAAAGSVSYAAHASHALQPAYALAVLALAAATSRMKVKLPGIDGNMSVNLPFLLTAVVSLSAAEAIAIACASTVVQCWPKPEAKFKPQQMVFNVSMMGFASSLATLIVRSRWLPATDASSVALALILATATLFLGQTAPVAAIVALSEGHAMRRVWWNVAQLSFPYYVVSAGMTSTMQMVGHRMGWVAALAVFPVMYGIHLSYRLYFARTAEALRPVSSPAPLARAMSAGA